MAIPRGNASIVCGASYRVRDSPSVIICDDVVKDPSDCLSPLTSAKSCIGESRYLARYFPANMPWPMTARQDALLEALMGDFRSFADDLVQRQPSAHAACALIDDDDDDDKDVAIHIVPWIADADVEFEDIAVVLAPPPPLLYTGAVVPFLGGERPQSTPNMLSAFDSATVPLQKTACRLKRPRHRPCRRNRPRAPNHSDEAFPSHPQPIWGGLQCRLRPISRRHVRTIGIIV